MSKDINNNGYDYVDLGLPSSTLWATCNVGANKPSESGLYFQWGDTKGYSKEQIGMGDGKKEFAFEDYKFNKSGDANTFMKYASTDAKLELEDDAAHVNMGGDWHMPSPEQIRELIDNTASTWEQLDGINGRRFTSKKDPSKSIFIPAAGYAWYSSVHVEGYYGDVWASTLSARFAQYLSFSSKSVGLDYFGCTYGHSVRGVIG